jgi:ferredoxin
MANGSRAWVSAHGATPWHEATMRVAMDRNLGEINPHRMSIVGGLELLPDFKLPVGFIANTRFGMMINRRLTGVWIKNRVTIRRECCQKCYRCLKICPASAIRAEQQGGISAIDQTR